MKKAFILGMAFATVIGSQALAAGTLKDLSTYKGTVSKAMVNPQTGKLDKAAVDTIAAKLNLRTSADVLAKSMKDSATSEKIIMLASAKELAVTRNDSSMAELVDVTAALVSRSSMKSDLKSSKADDPSMVAQQAIKKIEDNAETMLTQFQASERESYKKVLVEFDKQVAEQSLGSYEEKFLRAIEKSQGVPREKALEIAKKLRDCV